MARPNLTGVQPTRGGQQVPPGCYACIVKRAYYDDSNDTYKLVFDVLEQPFTGCYEAEEQGPDNGDGRPGKAGDFKHSVTVWFNRPDEYSKALGDLCTLDSWNPGFDAAASFNSGNDAAFQMKRCAVVRRREVRRKKDGTISDWPTWWKLVTKEEYESGRFKSPRDFVQKGLESYAEATDAAAREAEAAVAGAPEPDRVPDEVYSDDIPFG